MMNLTRKRRLQLEVFLPLVWVFLLEGMISLAAGVIVLMRPGLAGLALVLVIGAWTILTGILEMVAAIRLRREMRNEWMLGFGGFLSIVLGVLLLLQPAAGGLVIILMIGAYALIFGILLVAVGFRLRRFAIPPGRTGRDSIRQAR